MPDIYNCERAATTPLGGFFPAIGSMFGRKKGAFTAALAERKTELSTSPSGAPQKVRLN
jgi:hypothetical protein